MRGPRAPAGTFLSLRFWLFLRRGPFSGHLNPPPKGPAPSLAYRCLRSRLQGSLRRGAWRSTPQGSPGYTNPRGSETTQRLPGDRLNVLLGAQVLGNCGVPLEALERGHRVRGAQPATPASGRQALEPGVRLSLGGHGERKSMLWGAGNRICCVSS